MSACIPIWDYPNLGLLDLQHTHLQIVQVVRSKFSEKYERFLSLLIAERKAAGITQEQLARRLGRPQSFVSKYERGERRLDVVEFLAVTEAMGTDAEMIIARLQSHEAK